jgi:hypothetical protein
MNTSRGRQRAGGRAGNKLKRGYNRHGSSFGQTMMSMVRGDTIDSGEYLYVGTLSASDGGTMIPESPWCVDKRRGLMMIVQCGCTVTRCVCVCVCIARRRQTHHQVWSRVEAMAGSRLEGERVRVSPDGCNHVGEEHV